MIKTIYIIFSAFLLCTSINAQVIKGTSNANHKSITDDLTFGVKAGVGLSKFATNDFVDISHLLGFYVGGVAEVPMFFENFYLQPELILQFQGADLGEQNLNLTYIHVPVMSKYHFTEKIALELGPQVGFLLSDTWDESRASSDTNKFQLALNIGGGYRLDEHIYFQLRFTQGISKAFNNLDLKNVALQIGASYFF